jgi:hypothetical protein
LISAAAGKESAPATVRRSRRRAAMVGAVAAARSVGVGGGG